MTICSAADLQNSSLLTDKASYRELKKTSTFSWLSWFFVVVACASTVLADDTAWQEYLSRAEKSHAEKAYGVAEQNFLLAEKAAGADDEAVATILNVSANARCAQSQYKEAIAQYVRAAEIWTNKLRRKDLPYAVLLNNFGFCLYHSGDPARALATLEAARDLVASSKKPEPMLLSMIFNNLGEVTYHNSKFAEAEKYFQQSLDLRKAELDAGDPLLGVSYNNLAYVASALGKYDQAIPYYENALQIMERHFGESSPEVATAANNLAEACREFGNEERAESLLKRAIAIREKTPGSELAVSLNSLAELYLAANRGEEAVPLFKRAIALTEHENGPSSPVLTPMLESLALAEVSAGQYMQAEEIYRRLLRVASPPPFSNLAFVLEKQGLYEESERLYRRVVEESEKANGPKSVALVRPLRDLAEVLTLEKKFQDSLDTLVRAREILRGSSAENPSEMAAIMERIAAAQQSLGSCSEAADSLVEAANAALKAFGADSAELKELRARKRDLDRPNVPGCEQS